MDISLCSDSQSELFEHHSKDQTNNEAIDRLTVILTNLYCKCGKQIVPQIKKETRSRESEAVYFSGSRNLNNENTIRYVNMIRRIYAVRNEVFGVELFQDPSWEILLDLYCSTVRGDKVSVSALCYGSSSPHTTALRHLARLEELGFAKRTPDANDLRRFWVTALPKAIKPMEKLVTMLLEAGLEAKGNLSVVEDQRLGQLTEG